MSLPVTFGAAAMLASLLPEGLYLQLPLLETFLNQLSHDRISLFSRSHSTQMEALQGTYLSALPNAVTSIHQPYFFLQSITTNPDPQVCLLTVYVSQLKREHHGAVLLPGTTDPLGQRPLQKASIKPGNCRKQLPGVLQSGHSCTETLTGRRADGQ